MELEPEWLPLVSQDFLKWFCLWQSAHRPHFGPQNQFFKMYHMYKGLNFQNNVECFDQMVINIKYLHQNQKKLFQTYVGNFDKNFWHLQTFENMWNFIDLLKNMQRLFSIVVEPTHSLYITNALCICLHYSKRGQLMFTALFSFFSTRPAWTDPFSISPFIKS